MAEIPRGIRNNNPLNIRLDGTGWLGLSPQQTDPDFCQFTTPIYGIRAGARILKTYQREGITTIEAMIERWAPPSDDNPTQAYAGNVATACGVATADTIDITALLPKIIPAMIEQENGEQPYPLEDIIYAISLA